MAVRKVGVREWLVSTVMSMFEDVQTDSSQDGKG